VLSALAPGSYRLVVRKVGYAQINRSFIASAGDTVSLQVILAGLTPTLDAFKVLASQTAKERAYHIDAAAIAETKRPLFDAFDIIAKLRPDIVYGRGPCGGASNIWVNGRWIPRELVLQNSMAEARATGGNPGTHVSRAVLFVLSGIKPEHVAEMTYKDCLDTSMPGLHGSSALFVVLKPGVAYDPGRGSYAIAPGRDSVSP